MKKRILTLGIVVSLVAALVVPMAAFADDTVVSGEVPLGLELTAPAAIDFGVFGLGFNSANTSANGTAGTNNFLGLTVTVESDNITGSMSSGADNLTIPLDVTTGSVVGSPVTTAPVPCFSTGGPGGVEIDLSVDQIVVPGDVPGVYSIILTYTVYAN